MNILGNEIPDQIILFAVVGIGIILFLKFRKKDDTYPKADIDVEGPIEVKDIIKSSGKKIFNQKYTLEQGPITLGRITAFSPISWDSKASIEQNLANAKKKNELKALVDQIRGLGMNPSEIMTDNFYLFETIKNNMVAKILYLIGMGKEYYLPDMKLVTKSYKNYEINLYARPFKWFKNVYIFSEEGKAFIMNISDKLTVKKVCNGVVNMAPKIDYVEMKTANYAAKARELQERRHQDWKKKEQNLNPDEEPDM